MAGWGGGVVPGHCGTFPLQRLLGSSQRDNSREAGTAHQPPLVFRGCNSPGPKPFSSALNSEYPATRCPHPMLESMMCCLKLVCCLSPHPDCKSWWVETLSSACHSVDFKPLSQSTRIDLMHSNGIAKCLHSTERIERCLFPCNSWNFQERDCGWGRVAGPRKASSRSESPPGIWDYMLITAAQPWC